MNSMPGGVIRSRELRVLGFSPTEDNDTIAKEKSYGTWIANAEQIESTSGLWLNAGYTVYKQSGWFSGTTHNNTNFSDQVSGSISGLARGSVLFTRYLRWLVQSQILKVQV